MPCVCHSLAWGAWLQWPLQFQPMPNRQSIDNRYGNDKFEILSHNSVDRHPWHNSFSLLLPRADVTHCSFVSYYLHPCRYLDLLVCRNRHLNASQLQQEFVLATGPCVSLQTIRNHLHDIGLSAR